MYGARFAFVLGGCLVSLAGDARGDEGSIGLFSGGAFYRDDAALGSHGVAGSGFMFGGRAGIVLGDWTADGGTFGDTVGVEVDAGVASPRAGGDVSSEGERTARVLDWGVNAVIGHLSDRPVHPFTVFGIGGETLLDGRGGESDTDLSLRAGLGLLLHAGPGAIRIDARIAALSGRDDDVTAAGAIELGYSMRFGGRGPRVGRVQLARGGALPPPVFLVVRPAPPAPKEPGPPPAFAATGERNVDGIADAAAAPVPVWSERARLPDDAPPPVWLTASR
ncbi:MAG TPA: hypothetical protein VMZ28_27865 [Kofleriaceae bacterium]|nr:hypothetical protein [Kofleriaceae bacterium]